MSLYLNLIFVPLNAAIYIMFIDALNATSWNKCMDIIVPLNTIYTIFVTLIYVQIFCHTECNNWIRPFIIIYFIGTEWDKLQNVCYLH